MALKIFKSYTKSTRGTVSIDRKNLWKGKALKKLTFGKNRLEEEIIWVELLQEAEVLVVRISID